MIIKKIKKHVRSTKVIVHATRRKNLGDTLYIIHIPDVYHQFLVVKGKDIYLKQKNDIEISKNIACE